jgi:hypothetical protein
MIIAAIFFLIIVVRVCAKLSDRKYPYTSRYLLTKTEYAFYRLLKEKCDGYGFLICPKVRLEDFIAVTNTKQMGKYRGYIKSRHVDFLICDSKLHILAGLELDDDSHNRREARRTDEFKNRLFAKIGIPLYRIKTVPEDYERQIERMLSRL